MPTPKVTLGPAQPWVVQPKAVATSSGQVVHSQPGVFKVGSRPAVVPSTGKPKLTPAEKKAISAGFTP